MVGWSLSFAAVHGADACDSHLDCAAPVTEDGRERLKKGMPPEQPRVPACESLRRTKPRLRAVRQIDSPIFAVRALRSAP